MQILEPEDSFLPQPDRYNQLHQVHGSVGCPDIMPFMPWKKQSPLAMVNVAQMKDILC